MRGVGTGKLPGAGRAESCKSATVWAFGWRQRRQHL